MKRARTETDSFNILHRIKHSIVEKCFSISFHPFLKCVDEEQAQYKPFSHCQYHAGASFEDGNTHHWCFCKGKLLTLVISVWGTGITREMCLRAHISRGNTYHCNTGEESNTDCHDCSKSLLVPGSAWKRSRIVCACVEQYYCALFTAHLRLAMPLPRVFFDTTINGVPCTFIRIAIDLVS